MIVRNTIVMLLAAPGPLLKLYVRIARAANRNVTTLVWQRQNLVECTFYNDSGLARAAA